RLPGDGAGVLLLAAHRGFGCGLPGGGDPAVAFASFPAVEGLAIDIAVFIGKEIVAGVPRGVRVPGIPGVAVGLVAFGRAACDGSVVIAPVGASGRVLVGLRGCLGALGAI